MTLERIALPLCDDVFFSAVPNTTHGLSDTVLAARART